MTPWARMESADHFAWLAGRVAPEASTGMLDRNAIVDLNYEEDKLITVDFNLVATEDGELLGRLFQQQCAGAALLGLSPQRIFS